MTRKGSLRTQLTEHLLEAILHGELRPGDRIIEGKFARQLGVGQSTLREALQELEQRGLITKYGNRGTFVTKLTTREVEEIYAVRLELEPLAAAQAHQRITPTHSEQLVRFLDRMQSARQMQDVKELLRSDLAFHQLIWKLSNNSTLERALNLICAPLFSFYIIQFSSVESVDDFSKYSNDFKQDNEEHLELLAALNKGGPEEVRRTFRRILEVFRLRHIEHVQALQHDPENLPPNAREAVSPQYDRGGPRPA